MNQESPYREMRQETRVGEACLANTQSPARLSVVPAGWFAYHAPPLLCR